MGNKARIHNAVDHTIKDMDGMPTHIKIPYDIYLLPDSFTTIEGITVSVKGDHLMLALDLTPCPYCHHTPSSHIPKGRKIHI
jgi:hypothetical protein